MSIDKISQSLYLYGGMNIGKHPFLSHLRISIVGNAFFNIKKYLEPDAISSPHIGDSPRYIAPALYSIKKSLSLKLKDFFNINIKEIYDPYSIRNMHAHQSHNFNKNDKVQIKNIYKMIKNKNEKINKIAEEFVRLDNKYLKTLNSIINVNFSTWEGEEKYEKFLPEIEQNALNKGILIKDENGVFINLERHSLKPLMLKDKDNLYQFQAYNLAVISKAGNCKVNEKIIFDHRKFDYNYKQIFSAIKDLSINTQNLKFISIGGINDHSGKSIKIYEKYRIPLIDFINNFSKYLNENIFIKKIGKEKFFLSLIKLNIFNNKVSKDYNLNVENINSLEYKILEKYLEMRLHLLASKSNLDDYYKFKNKYQYKFLDQLLIDSLDNFDLQNIIYYLNEISKKKNKKTDYIRLLQYEFLFEILGII